MLLDSNFWGRRVAILLGLLALTTVVAVGAAEDVEALRARAEARWAALITGEFDKAYQFETPAYRAIYNVRQFRARYGRGILWRNAKVIKVDLKSQDVAAVTVEIDYSFYASGRGMMDDKASHTETWLLIDGEWWYREVEPTPVKDDSKS